MTTMVRVRAPEDAPVRISAVVPSDGTVLHTWDLQPGEELEVQAGFLQGIVVRELVAPPPAPEEPTVAPVIPTPEALEADDAADGSGDSSAGSGD